MILQLAVNCIQKLVMNYANIGSKLPKALQTLQQTSDELQQTHGELKKTRDELQKTHDELQQTHHQLQEMQERVTQLEKTVISHIRMNATEAQEVQKDRMYLVSCRKSKL